MTDNLFKLSEDWGNIKYGSKIIVMGTGRIGRRVLPVLLREFEIPFLMDKNCNGEIISGIKILDIEEGVQKAKDQGYKIIVTTMRGAYEEISSILKKYGLSEDTDYCLFERFAQEWNLRWQNKCVLAKIDTVITSRCSLNCRNCNIFISHIRDPKDIEYKELIRNFDILFDSVNYVYEYTLLGGEPFRHNNIADIIQYLGEEYRDKIGKINLISNGTIIPDEATLNMLSKYDASVHISDYTGTVPYDKRLEEVKEILKKNGIEYYVIRNNVWKNIVFPDMSYTAEDPNKHMLLCGHSTHSVGDGKLYWCDPAFAAEYFMGFESKPDDYLDLKSNKENNSKHEASLNILRYFLGNVNDRGYMSICEKCAGIGSDNNREVIAGEQAGNK